MRLVLQAHEQATLRIACIHIIPPTVANVVRYTSEVSHHKKIMMSARAAPIFWMMAFLRYNLSTLRTLMIHQCWQHAIISTSSPHHLTNLAAAVVRSQPRLCRWRNSSCIYVPFAVIDIIDIIIIISVHHSHRPTHHCQQPSKRSTLQTC